VFLVITAIALGVICVRVEPPDALKKIASMPHSSALLFMIRKNPSIEPPTSSARATAAPPADITITTFRSSLTVYDPERDSRTLVSLGFREKSYAYWLIGTIVFRLICPFAIAS
jgi:hypothetical protein